MDKTTATARLGTWEHSASEVSDLKVALSCPDRVVVIWSNYCDTGVGLSENLQDYVIQRCSEICYKWKAGAQSGQENCSSVQKPLVPD